VNPERMRTIGSWRLLFPVLMLVAAGIFGLMLVRHGPTNLDAPLLPWFRDSSDPGRVAGPDGAASFWLALSWLGDGTPRIVVAVLTVIGLLRIRHWQTAVVSVGILLSGSLLLCFAVARSYGPDALPWKPVDNE
jgi:hypothetical protein